MRPLALLALFAALPALAVHAEELTIEISGPSRVMIATAIERGSTVDVAGSIADHTARFTLQPDKPYDIAISLADGTMLMGVDLSWYDDEPADAQAEPLGDDDREQIRAIVEDIPQFADKPKLLNLKGSHDRAAALVELARTSAFHAAKPGEVICRWEVWFFKWQTGGWERVAQQSRLLRRQRFDSSGAFDQAKKQTRWIPQLGGVKLGKDAAAQTLRIPLSPPATTASGSTAAHPAAKP